MISPCSVLYQCFSSLFGGGEAHGRCTGLRADELLPQVRRSHSSSHTQTIPRAPSCRLTRRRHADRMGGHTKVIQQHTEAHKPYWWLVRVLAVGQRPYPSYHIPRSPGGALFMISVAWNVVWSSIGAHTRPTGPMWMRDLCDHYSLPTHVQHLGMVMLAHHGTK